ncbi:MAG: hypothetical protein D6790_15180 [Caldilineae bacterium]|nr:MAG: hypothetical protein D6790_15180 [Caldilineae bacterium]
MNRYRLVGHALGIIFFVGAALFNYPILRLFSRPAFIFGVPLLYAYLFIVWLVLIGMMTLIVERK